MVAGLGVELGDLIEAAVVRGGHVRVGLEDAPMGCTLDNLQLVHQARRRIEGAGGRLASAAQVRERLKAAHVR
jgi:3-keto-5-aminohexanoate cleavage enzyme